MLREKFCNRLRVVRTEKGLNQENMAELIGMSVNGYAKIERGETDVSLGKIEQLAQVLEVEVADLLQLTTQNKYINNSGHAQVLNVEGTLNLKVEDTEVLKRLAALEQKLG